MAARVVSAARTAKGAPVERLEPAACVSYVPLQSPAAAPAAPLHLGAYYHAPDGRVLRLDTVVKVYDGRRAVPVCRKSIRRRPARPKVLHPGGHRALVLSAVELGSE